MITFFSWDFLRGWDDCYGFGFITIPPTNAIITYGSFSASLKGAFLGGFGMGFALLTTNRDFGASVLITRFL